MILYYILFKRIFLLLLDFYEDILKIYQISLDNLKKERNFLIKNDGKMII